MARGYFFLAPALALALAAPFAAHAEPGGEQGEARKEMRAGNVRSLREIEQRIKAQLPGMEFLGSAYDPAGMAYRLRFIREGRVVDVDVDARSGKVIRMSH